MAAYLAEKVGAEARASRRRRALLRAALRTASGERRANILNLSTGGALLDAARPPALGEPVTLIRDALVAPGRVTWTRDHRFGVTFDEAISDADVRHVTERAPD
jgi:hypothetical protein